VCTISLAGTTIRKLFQEIGRPWIASPTTQVREQATCSHRVCSNERAGSHLHEALPGASAPIPRSSSWSVSLSC
jgi:hypothetical protein